MNSQLEKLNLKCEHDEDDGDQNKSKKLKVPEDADAMSNLNDVDDDCLIDIFKHLILQDLINIADTCKRFQTMAQWAFVERYNGKTIKLYPSSSNRIQPTKLFVNAVVISDLRSCLKVLRHFGVKISKLDISCYYLGEYKKVELAWYMNEYCVDSLIDLKIEKISNGMITIWTKPFLKVESIQYWGCNLIDFSVWFPNVRRFILSRSSQCILYTFPHLEELEISSGEYEYTSESITKMFFLNQHIQILRLAGVNCNMKFLKSVSGYLQSIRLLDISCVDNRFFNSDGDLIYLKNVNEFHINLTRFDSLPKIPFTFDKLVTIKMSIRKFNLNENFEDFIRKNPSLGKLTLRYFDKSTISIGEIKSSIAETSPSIDVEFEKVSPF